MTMQYNIDIVRRILRRNVDEPELQTLAGKIDNQRPVFVPVAISANNGQRRADRFEIERNGGFTNVTEVPDLVRVCRQIDNLLRQFIVSVSYNQHAHCFNQCAP